MADMHLCYGRAHGNAREAYEEQFPGRLIPDARMFTSIHRSLMEKGKFIPATNGREDPEQCVLQIWKMES
jgi:hypothetical protein